MKSFPLHPARLAPGATVGHWRIVDRRGRGAVGAVYLVEGVEPEASGDAALKLALFPRDARFAREVEVLSRLDHPGVPRLIGHGHWKAAAGTFHPYLVMQWVEGLPLYAWPHACAPSSRQALRVLAQVARALESLHSEGAFHRDVKGDNVLVRLGDSQAFLVDFGSASWPGAAPLTSEVFPPGTPAYRAPEAFRFAAEAAERPGQTYAHRPEDDLFALGVAAYRLVTEQYPPSREPQDAESSAWSEQGTGPRPPREVNPRCCVELSAAVSRLLSIQPEARGSAGGLAEALERAARQAGPEADVPLFPREAAGPVDAWARAPHRLRPVEEVATPGHAGAREHRWSWRSSLAVVGLTGAVALGTVWLRSTQSWEEATRAQVAGQEEAADTGTAAVGDAVLTAPAPSMPPSSVEAPIALDLPDKPFKGQVRPDANGRCPHKGHVAINGGCWVETKVAPKDCAGTGYVYKGGCYMPLLSPERPSTSNPTDAPDGGQ